MLLAPNVSIHEKQVLVVEDDPLLNRLFSKSIARLGVQVESVHSIETARTYLSEISGLDLLVLDLQLGDGHACDLQAVLNAQPFLDTRVIVVSGYTFTRESCWNNLEYVLLKPVKPTWLSMLVHSLLTDAS